MYPSPLRDDGYDISSFLEIHPDLGTVNDFRNFMDAAHARGLKVIADLVMNHTSDQHPWFQEARRNPKSPKRVIRNAFLAAAAAVGRSIQKPISR